MNESLLIALVPGVSREDLALAATPFLGEALAGEHGVARLFTPQGRAPIDAFFADDLVAELQRLGVPVDRRTWLLRPKWQGDDAALQALAGKATERTTVTFLYLSDVAHAACVHGPGSPGHLAALRQLDARIERALDTKKVFGERPALALLTFGAVRPVQRCFDPLALLRRELARSAWLRRNRASAHVAPGLLEVKCHSWTQVRHFAACLAQEPFSNHGRLVAAGEARAAGLQLAPDHVWFVPHRGVAFGRQEQRGMLPLFPDAPAEVGCAALPWLAEPRRDLDLAEVRTGLLAHVRELARRLGTADRSALPDLAPATKAASRTLADVEPVLQHDGFEVVEDAAHVDALLGVRAREE